MSSQIGKDGNIAAIGIRNKQFNQSGGVIHGDLPGRVKSRAGAADAGLGRLVSLCGRGIDVNCDAAVAFIADDQLAESVYGNSRRLIELGAGASEGSCCRHGVIQPARTIIDIDGVGSRIGKIQTIIGAIYEKSGDQETRVNVVFKEGIAGHRGGIGKHEHITAIGDIEKIFCVVHADVYGCRQTGRSAGNRTGHGVSAFCADTIESQNIALVGDVERI